MSTGFPFGAKPANPPAFGQTSTGFGQTAGFGAFGTPAPTTTAALPQFAATWGAKTTSSNFQYPSAPATASLAPAFGVAPSATTQPSLNTTSFAPGGGFAYSAPAPASTSSGTGLFGTPTLQSTFGTPTSQSTFGTPTTQGTFAVPTTQGTFGVPTTQAAFGVPATQAAFGVPATQSTFGTPTAQGTFGIPATQSAFGIPPTQNAFGGIPANTTGAGLTLGGGQSSNFTLGGPSLTAKTVGPPIACFIPPSFINMPASVGKSTAPSAPTFNTPASTALSIGSLVPPTTKSTFGIPVSSAAPTLSFSTPQTSVTSTSLAFAAPASSATPSLFAAPMPSTPSSTITLNFTTPTVATSAPAPASTSFSLGATTTTSAEAPFFVGASLLKPPSTAAPLSFSVQPVTTPAMSAAQRVGLGGVSATPPKSTAGTAPTSTAQADLAPRDQALPNELLQQVEGFKKFLQEQKSFSSEIARFSMKDLKRVETDVEQVNNHMNELQSELQKNKGVADTLQFNTAKDLQNAEMAQRTFDTPAGLQYENTAPFNYFLELANTFEKDVHDLKVRIENIDKHVRNTGPTTALSSQDLSLGMRRLHETFVALAGRLQSLHNQVEFQKEQYLNLRKQVMNDYTNVFETQSKEEEALEIALDSIAYKPPAVSTGPTPFSSLGNSQAQVLAQNQSAAYPGTTALATAASSGFAPSQNYSTLFGSALGNASLFNTSASTAFQLQKPPVGNKRGKP